MGGSNPNRSLGAGFLWLAAIGVLAGLTWAFSGLTPERGGIVASGVVDGRASVVLEQGRGGHYVAEGAINGRPVQFLVDTGATDVAVSEALAREIGLEFGPRIGVMTAAGPVRAWMTRLDSVRVGVLELRNVRATITPSPMASALLGMSFLKHFSLSQQGGRLIIETTNEAS